MGRNWNCFQTPKKEIIQEKGSENFENYGIHDVAVMTNCVALIDQHYPLMSAHHLHFW